MVIYDMRPPWENKEDQKEKLKQFVKVALSKDHIFMDAYRNCHSPAPILAKAIDLVRPDHGEKLRVLSLDRLVPCRADMYDAAEQADQAGVEVVFRDKGDNKVWQSRELLKSSDDRWNKLQTGRARLVKKNYFSQGAPSGIRDFEKATRAFVYFQNKKEEMSVSEIIRRVRMTKPTFFRQMRVMTAWFSDDELELDPFSVQEVGNPIFLKDKLDQINPKYWDQYFGGYKKSFNE